MWKTLCISIMGRIYHFFTPHKVSSYVKVQDINKSKSFLSHKNKISTRTPIIGFFSFLLLDWQSISYWKISSDQVDMNQLQCLHATVIKSFTPKILFNERKIKYLQPVASAFLPSKSHTAWRYWGGEAGPESWPPCADSADNIHLWSYGYQLS